MIRIKHYHVKLLVCTTDGQWYEQIQSTMAFDERRALEYAERDFVQGAIEGGADERELAYCIGVSVEGEAKPLTKETARVHMP